MPSVGDQPLKTMSFLSWSEKPEWLILIPVQPESAEQQSFFGDYHH